MEISSKFRILLAFAIMLSVLFASSAFANGLHTHHQHSDSISPFSKNKKLSLHCILKGHSINDLCPHLLKTSKDKTIPSVIGSGCGTHPFPKKSNTNGFNLQFIENSHFQTQHYQTSQTLFLDSPSISLSNNDAVDPPPKLS